MAEVLEGLKDVLQDHGRRDPADRLRLGRNGSGRHQHRATRRQGDRVGRGRLRPPLDPHLPGVRHRGRAARDSLGHGGRSGRRRAAAHGASRRGRGVCHAAGEQHRRGPRHRSARHELWPRRRALLVVDAISGAGSLPCYTDRWQIDLVVVGSQKALMLPPGLAVVAVSPKAWRQIDRIAPQAFYFNLKHYRQMLPETPWTPAITLVVGLAESLRQIRSDRHRRVLGAVRDAGPGHPGGSRGAGAHGVCRAAGGGFDRGAQAGRGGNGHAAGPARRAVRHQAGQRARQAEGADFSHWALWG